jgi:hypothetical protein
MVTMRCRPSRAPAAVARASKDSREETRAELKERMTRGRWRSRRWTAAACTAAAGGAAPAAEQEEQRSREAEGVQRKKKRGEVQGLVWNI